MIWRPRLPQIAADPDARVARWGWLAWFVVTFLLAWQWWRGGPHDGEGMIVWVIGAPALALWVLWPLWHGIRKFWHWTRARPFAEWHGAYFEFHGRQIRVLFVDEDLWIAAADVFDVLGLHGRAREAERVRQIVGRDGLTAAPGTGLLAFTERGFAAWMERRTDRAAADFKRWFETQVVAPYRRKRALVAGIAKPRDGETTTRARQ
jgi:hypothetical protein